MFQAAPAKSWESGQRPRNLKPHEMPWARDLPASLPLTSQKSVLRSGKSLAPTASNLASLTSEASLDAAVLAQEEARREAEVRRAADGQQGHAIAHKSAVSLQYPAYHAVVGRFATRVGSVCACSGRIWTITNLEKSFMLFLQHVKSNCVICVQCLCT